MEPKDLLIVFYQQGIANGIENLLANHEMSSTGAAVYEKYTIVPGSIGSLLIMD